MKKVKNLKAFVLLALATMFVLMMNVCAINMKDMKENGEISDGPVVFGDERDGVVSDVSSDMSGLGGAVSEFVDDVIPDMSSSPKETSRVNMNSDITGESSSAADSTVSPTSSKNAVLGITVAVVLAVAVVALIFLFVKRK